MKESELVKRLLAAMTREGAIKRIPFRYWRVESHDTQIGIPDLVLFVGACVHFVECKTERGSLQPAQLGQLRDLRKRFGQESWLFRLLDDGRVVIIDPLTLEEVATVTSREVLECLV